MAIKILLNDVEPKNKSLADSLRGVHKKELLELAELYATDPEYVRKKTWRQLARFFGNRWDRPRLRGETLKRTVEVLHGDQKIARQSSRKRSAKGRK